MIHLEVKKYEVEIITIKGAIFGKLYVSSVCIAFKSEERKTGVKYRFGSTNYNRLNKRLNKKWKLGIIKQVLVKRYNLIRQAVEIYFNNSKSVFISFFDKQHLSKFIYNFKSVVKKKTDFNIEIIENPETYFAQRKFKEKWVLGQISNFEYLMELNKYSGRSFHDISQYPVFPWVIKEYGKEKIEIKDPRIYRDLRVPIAAISEEKRKKIESFGPTYQHQQHYLPKKEVFSYMLRLEPFSSLSKQFEQENKVKNEILHVLNEKWEKCMLDTNSNFELIPEFYYLPSLCANYNNYYYGIIEPHKSLSLPCIVRVDQVILPIWANNCHHFIQLNSLALESKTVTHSLDKWIDLIFGEKQQDPKSYNLFNEICDEETINKKLNQLKKTDIVEINEYGINPIRMFKEKHPSVNEAQYQKRNQYALFTNETSDEERLFALLRIHTFKQPIIFIEAYESKVIAILNTQRICRTKEEYINAPHEKSFTFEKKDIPLFPFIKFYEEATSTLICDAKKALIVLDNGNYIISCRHYDNSCKIINCSTGEVHSHLYFHKAIVTALCVVENDKYLFSASRDGVVVKWDIRNYKEHQVRPLSNTCDHNLAVVSIDASKELDLFASGSLDGTIALREISNWKFLRLLHPNLIFNKIEYVISHVRLSPRGYVVIVARAKLTEAFDIIIVQSINGEFIKQMETNDNINCLILDETGYYFLTGGRTGKISKYDIITLEAFDLLEDLDGELPGIERSLQELLSTNNSITALAMTKKESCQQLLIGTSSGEFFSYKYSPRLTGGKIFDTLQGLIVNV